MVLTITTVIISIVLMILAILFLPKITIKKVSIDTFWIPPFIGALIILLSGSLKINVAIKGLTNSSGMNPVKILTLFISMTFISIVLDELGFFKFLAIKVLNKAKSSQFLLFGLLYLTTAILTVFTSNDIIILTFTPFIIFFCKHGNINPIPFLFAEFTAANTWSMLLLIGNPTNIYLSTSLGLDFFSYLQKMFVPTIFAGISSLIVLFVLFRKSLTKTIETTENESFHIDNKVLMSITLLVLIATTLLLVFSSFLQLEMYLITLSGACLVLALLLLSITFYHKSITVIKNSLKNLPYKLIPFILAMFIVTLALKEYGVCSDIAVYLDKKNPVLTYGISSFISANIINNIPMSVLFANIIQSSSLVNFDGAIYAAIIGSNLGALFTPIGALAGIMWMGLLKKNNVHCSFLTFMKYGTLIAIPTLIASLIALIIIL